MCELLICAIDKTSTNPSLDCALPKRGVVIETYPDDHSYGGMELSNPMFRILALPGTPMAYGQALMAAQTATTAAPAGMRLNLLQWASLINIDDASIPAAVAAYLADTTRAAGRFSVDPAVWPLAAITALTVTRPSVAPSAIPAA